MIENRGENMLQLRLGEVHKLFFVMGTKREGHQPALNEKRKGNPKEGR